MAQSVNEEQNKASGRPAKSTDASEPRLPHIDVREKGRNADGGEIALDRRLFMQFMAFEYDGDVPHLSSAMKEANLQAALYQDINDPRGVGLATFCENPAYLLETIQPWLSQSAFQSLRPKPEYTMLGRTYSIGYESDLEEVLLHRPIKRICDPQLAWVVWYPVRRSGDFETESREEQRKMLMEHGGIGHAFGKAGLATDIRLAGQGLNKDDNDFIIGLLGQELFPLSALVQRMRRTRQTSQFIQHMGPFFVGRVIWQPTFESFSEGIK